MYEPDELAGQLTDLGWKADIKATRWFLFGTAHPELGESIPDRRD